MRRLTSSLRYFTPTKGAQALDRLSFLERGSANVLAGWIVKTPDLQLKIAWGRHFGASMECAARLRERAKALRAGGEDRACVPSSWHDQLHRIDESKEALVVLRGIEAVKRELVDGYADYLSNADPISDAASVEIVNSARRSAVAQVKWMSRRAGGQRNAPLRVRRASGAEIAMDDALWPPIDRVPQVARPGQMKRSEPGALRILPIRPRSRKDTGIFLHNFLNEEFATLELIARNSYEHPDMPWAFHRDAGRHASDEARHAEMFMRALPEYGVRFGDYPIYTYSYEGEYEFPGTDVAPGSRRELLWRILLRQVVHEGLALDSTPFEMRKREYLRQPELARIFGFILADEVFHAGSGVKWSRYLVDGVETKFESEREAAYSYYKARLKERRLTWGASHIEEAAKEEKQLEELSRHHKFPFHIEVNVAARKKAGYSDLDIHRMAEDRVS